MNYSTFEIHIFNVKRLKTDLILNYKRLVVEGIAEICAVAHRELLPASLTDDTANKNDRNKHKVTVQMNHQTADPKANAFVLLFFPTAHFLKTILARRTNGTFAFAPTHKADPSAKAKEPFFANAPTNK